MVLLNDRAEKAFNSVTVCLNIHEDADTLTKNNYHVRKEEQNKELEMLLLWVKSKAYILVTL